MALTREEMAARAAAESAAAIISEGHRAQNEPRTAAADDLQEQS